MNTITIIDRDLLKALLLGGKITESLSRKSEPTGKEAHVVIVEMPKNVMFEDKDKYWKYLVFLHTPDMGYWWHASSNNLSKRDNVKKAWNEETGEGKHKVKLPEPATA